MLKVTLAISSSDRGGETINGVVGIREYKK
jgi:hypothetical protein